MNAENRKLQEFLETSRRFCETLVGHMFFKGDEMSQSTALTVKTMLAFLECIFHFCFVLSFSLNLFSFFDKLKYTDPVD